jgi:hypothetical protein
LIGEAAAQFLTLAAISGRRRIARVGELFPREEGYIAIGVEPSNQWQAADCTLQVITGIFL